MSSILMHYLLSKYKIISIFRMIMSLHVILYRRRYCYGEAKVMRCSNAAAAETVELVAAAAAVCCS